MQKAVEEFVPTKFMWVCIKNKRYDQRRQETGSSAFQDLESVEEDAQNFRVGVKSLSAKMKDIREFSDLKY